MNEERSMNNNSSNNNNNSNNNSSSNNNVDGNTKNGHAVPMSSPETQFFAAQQTPDFFSANSVLGKRRSNHEPGASPPSLFPRRSPRFAALLSTPTFSMPSPTLPSILTENPFELRRSPGVASGRNELPTHTFLSSLGPSSYSPSTAASQGALDDNLNMGRGHPVSISMKSFSSANGGVSRATGRSNMSILNKLQQQNYGQMRKRQRNDLGNKLKTSSASGAMFSQFSPPSQPMPPPMEPPQAPQSSDTNNQSPPLRQMPKTSGNGSGSSCHQCKSRRTLDNLIFCCNMFKRREKKRQGATKDKRHACRKKYCDQCLLKFYHEKPPRKRQDPTSEWQCPACRSICCCAACRRHKAKAQQAADPLRMSPATSLACGLVYFKDMLKFKLGEAAPSPPDLRKAIHALTQGQGTFNNSGAGALSKSQQQQTEAVMNISGAADTNISPLGSNAPMG